MNKRDDFDSWAEVYDEIYDEKLEDGEDVEFYRSLIKSSEEPALEMACGTGRLYNTYLSEGYNIHGLDISEGMLERLRSKCSERGLEPTVFQGDSKTVELEDQYGLIYYPFSSIAHLQGVKNQRQLFQNCYDHLQEGGIFAFDIFTPSFEVISNYGTIRRESFTSEEGITYTIEKWSKLSNEANQEFDNKQRAIREDSGEIIFDTTFSLTLLPKEQLELLVLDAGFSDYTVYGGFDREPIQGDSERLVFVAEK